MSPFGVEARGARLAAMAWVACVIGFLTALGEIRAAETPSPVAGLVRLLKSGKAPAERLPAMLEMIGKRGSADDLDYLLACATSDPAYSREAKQAALDALASAFESRGVQPNSIERALEKPIRDRVAEPALAQSAIRLAGLWRVESLAPMLSELALAADADASTREASIYALASLGGDTAQATLDRLASSDADRAWRYLGASNLARIDLEQGAIRAVEALQAANEDDDLGRVLDVFLGVKGGAETLAGAIERSPPSADVAKLGLRHLYAIGRADARLTAALSSAAGVAADLAPPTAEEVRRLSAEVVERGDAARGERVFRRADLSCLRCHSISKAGGSVGPDLSAVGSISPVDFVVTSILQPELAVKEAFQMATVETGEGHIHQGIIVEENSDVLVLKDAEGKLTRIPADDENEIRKGGSLMPKGLVNLMTHQELLDLARFISELGKPGEYAIRPNLTLQRYRVLSPTPPALLAGTPDFSMFKAQVFDAAPSSWRPLYAKVAGGVPLVEAKKLAGAKTVFLFGEVEIVTAGTLRVDIQPSQGATLWLDEQPAADLPATVDVAVGRRRLTLRVEMSADSPLDFRVELTRPEGSSVDFTIVGGP